MTDSDDRMRWMLHHRGVDTPCPKCHGFGSLSYSSGSTWGGGMGTCSFAWDVCDTCWGTGDEHRHGVNLRELRDNENRRVAERAVALLVSAAECRLADVRPAVLELIAELDKLARGRKKRATWFHVVCSSLADKLRKGCQQ